MKRQVNPEAVPYLILGCGGIGAALRALMFNKFVDEKGLIVSGNPPHILVLLLTAAVVVLTLVTVRKLGGSNRFHDNFSVSPTGGIMAIAAAVGVLSLLIGHWNDHSDNLATAWKVLSILSIPSLIFTGICRIRGKRPSFQFHGIVCLFFAIHLANQYRVWSGNPELADYCWQLLACVGLMLTAYYHAAFDVGLGKRRMQLSISLLTAYFCILSTPDTGYGLFYLTCGLWSISNLASLHPHPRRRKPEAPAPEEPV